MYHDMAIYRYIVASLPHIHTHNTDTFLPGITLQLDVVVAKGTKQIL